MAAKMKFCRYLFRNMDIFTILCAVLVFPNPNFIEAATTQPPATTAAQTTLPVTVPVTTVTIPPTTTTPVPATEPRTVIGETDIGASCLCDVTGNQCDVNCCCDSDCSTQDVEAFTCDLVSVVIPDKLCYKKEVFLFTNSPATTEITDDGLFCIFTDNYQTRNFYLDPEFILDGPSFQEYVDKYAKPSLQTPVTNTEAIYTLNSYYKSGDPVLIVYPNNSTGTMVLPTSLASSQCTDQNPMGYLSEANVDCSRLLVSAPTTTIDAATCTNTAAISAASYYTDFRVVKTPALFGYVENGTFIAIPTTVAPTTAGVTTPTPDPSVTTQPTVPTQTTQQTTQPAVDPALVQDLYNNPYTLAIDVTTQTHLCVQLDGTLANCAFTTPPTPTFTNNMCQNVVYQARYIVTTNGTDGISSVEVQFVFRDLPGAVTSLTQTFTVTYNSLQDTNVTEERSGNPGYLLDKPIRYGTKNTTTDADGVTTSSIILNTDTSRGLTIVRSLPSGVCGPLQSRKPLQFGQNMRSGCTISLNLTGISVAECQSIQQTIVETLEGPNTPIFDAASNVWLDNNRYVATFGNTDINKVGDWVKVIVDGRPIPNTAPVPADTCKLKIGQHIQVLYANVGALANPQAKIIGVALLYDTAKDIKFRCTGAFCQDANADLSQAFEVSQTVSFVDVSQPAVKYQGEAPIFIAKVPSDFFYPFLVFSGASSVGQSYNIVTVLVSMMLTAFLNGKYGLT